MTATLFGRSAELAELHSLARAAAAGAGGFVFVEGDAGIGKTALLDTFAALATVEHGAIVLRGRAWEEGGAPPFWPWHEIAIAGGWAVEWARHDDPFILYQQVLTAARTATLASRGPLILIVDDLHAADEDTIRLTRFMARSIADTPIALVAAARPSDHLTAVVRLGSRLELAALGDGFADDVIMASAAGPLDPATRARIRVAAEGNPLFLRELARSAITGRRIPVDILSIVTPVIERQTDETRLLVEHAAVLGRSFRLDRLAAVSGRTRDEVLYALEPLRHDGVISLSGEPLFGMFSHQLIRDVLYESVAPARRLEIHAAVAKVLARESGSGSLAERAHHLLAAVPVVDAAAAGLAARHAATQARANLAFSEAASLLRRAAELTTDDHERVALLVEIGTNWRDSGQVGVASISFDEAIDLARRIDDPVAFAKAVLARTHLVRWENSATEFTAVIGDALARLRTASPGQQGEAADLTVRLLARRATLLAVGNDMEAPLSAARDALRAARDLGPGHDIALADALAAMHRCCWAPSQLSESLAIGQEMVAVTDRLDDLDVRSEALLAQLIDSLRAGDINAVDRTLDQYATLVAHSRRPRHEFFLLSRRAMRAFLAGRLADGDRLIERAFELGQRIEEPDAFQVYHGARMVVVDQLQEQGETLAAAQLVDGMARAGESRLFVYTAHSYLVPAAMTPPAKRWISSTKRCHRSPWPHCRCLICAWSPRSRPRATPSRSPANCGLLCCPMPV